MESHRGKVLELIIRKNGFNISELARNLNVSRKSIYYWFNQQRIKPDIIYRIGSAINYDFSTDFPDLFPLGNEKLSEEYWKNKYLEVYKKYKELLKNKK